MRSPSVPAASQAMFRDAGEMGSLVGAHDWGATAIGPAADWPPEMKAVLAFVLKSPTPIVTLWGETGVMIYNDAYRVFAGMRHPDLLGSNVLEGWHEVADFNANVLQKVYREGGTLSYRDQELTLVRDGTPQLLWTDLEYSPAIDADGAVLGVIAIVIETTERVLAERRAATEHERGRVNAERVQLALGAGAIIGTWFWDLPSDQFTVDAAFAQSFGLDPALGHSGIPLEQIIATVHPEDRDGLVAAIDAVIARSGTYAHQYRVRRTDGRYYWIEANGRVDHAADGTPKSFPGVLIDVEERRAVEAERDRAIAMLRALNEELEQRAEARTRELRDTMDFARLALTAVGGVGVWTYDIATDAFTCDANISKLYDIDAGQGARGIRRADFLANVHKDDRPALRATMADGLINPGDRELEYRIVHRDGSVRWVLSRGHTYFDDAGKPVRRTGVGVDMTRQRLVEEQLRQAQKMEAVGQLTGGLAHDFNNLLAGISGSLELIDMRLAQGRHNDVERYTAAARGATRRAAALTHRLLAFSRRQTLDPKPTNVNRLVAGMEELVRRTVGPAVQLEVIGAAGLWPALVDASQLENALLNLCINARDAMPAGGRIMIETANTWLDAGAAKTHGLAEGQYLSLSVTDTGTGMSPEIRERVFEPFFTTKPLGEGTGLGLSMIYGFAQQSGGQVRIYSEVGEGTTVCIYLPRHHMDGDVEELPVEVRPVARSEQGETVLIVDDEPTVRMLVADVLHELGYSAIEAADSVAGLKILQSDVRIDLLVSDVGLPGGMNGRQMADAARQSRPDLKVLFITGYAENAAVGPGRLDPGMAVITKPFAVDVLAARVQEMIAQP